MQKLIAQKILLHMKYIRYLYIVKRGTSKGRLLMRCKRPKQGFDFSGFEKFFEVEEVRDVNLESERGVWHRIVNFDMVRSSFPTSTSKNENSKYRLQRYKLNFFGKLVFLIRMSDIYYQSIACGARNRHTRRQEKWKDHM